MKVILYNAVSLDGLIATPSGDSDWALDGEEFEAIVKETGCLLVGRTTFEQYYGEIYPMQDVTNFVYTSAPSRFTQETAKNLQLVSGKPQHVLEAIAERGFEKVILAGGGQTNASFAEAKLIDELVLDIHPLLLGKGIRLFGNFHNPLNLELISSVTNPKGFMQNRYKVLS